MTTTFIYIGSFIALLGVLVAIHEYGQEHNVPKTPAEHTILTRLENLRSGKVASEIDAKKIFGYLKKVNNNTDFDFSEIAPNLFL